MNDIQQVWTPQTPPATPKNPLTTPVILFTILFLSLLFVSVPAVVLLQRSDRSVVMTSENIEIPQLLANCAFFYQLCPTSSRGIAEQETVYELLVEKNSPLTQTGPLLHPQLDEPTAIETTPDQIMTLIATRKNINPFLLLTLTEMDEQMFTQASTANQTIENSGEKSAWFSIQHQQIADELLSIAKEIKLDPAATDEKYQKKTVKVSNQEVQLPNDISLATGVLIEYFASHSSSLEEFKTNINSFSSTYQELFGIDPGTTTN